MEDVKSNHQTTLYLGNRQLTTLDGVEFPPSLTKLHLYGNQLTTLDGAKFPPSLTHLGLADNWLAHYPWKLRKVVCVSCVPIPHPLKKGAVIAMSTWFKRRRRIRRTRVAYHLVQDILPEIAVIISEYV